MATDKELVEAFLARTNGLTQMDAADAAGVSQRSVSRWRTGDRGRLHNNTRAQLVKYLRGDEETPEEAAASVGGGEQIEDPAATDDLLLDDLLQAIRGCGPPGAKAGQKQVIYSAMGSYLLSRPNKEMPEWYEQIGKQLQREEL